MHTRLYLSAITTIALTTAVPAEELLEATLDPVDLTSTANRTPAPPKQTTTPVSTVPNTAPANDAKAPDTTPIPSSHVVLTADTIRANGYDSVSEALASQSGFSFYRSGGKGTTSGLFLRGSGSEDLLVLLDGVPLTDYSNPSAAAMLDAIDIDSVERIELLKGAQSGIWGSNALSGVVNIVTRSATAANGGSVGMDLGNDSTKSFNFSANKSGQKGSIGFSGHAYDTDGFSAMLPRDSEPDGAQMNDWHFHATLNDGPNSHVDTFAHHSSSAYDYDTTDANDTSAHGTSTMTMIGGGYHYNGTHLFVDTQLSLTTIERDSQDVMGTFDGSSDATRASLSGGYRGESQQIMIGMDYARISARTISGSAWGSFPTEGAFTDKALFAHYTKTFQDFLGARTTIDGAVRYDVFDAFDNKATYRLGIRRDCDALPGLHTAASLSSGYKAPSLYALSTATSPLKPTYTHGYELSVGYKTWLEATYFHTTTQDRIVYDPATFLPFNSPEEDTISGIELNSRFQVGDTGLSLGANMTHFFTLEDANGDPLIRRAKDSANLFVDYQINPVFQIGANLHYVGERYDTVYDPATFANQQVTLPSYTTLDLNFGAKFENGLDLSLHIQNVLDKEYETVKGYNTGGRRVTAKLRYQF